MKDRTVFVNYIYDHQALLYKLSRVYVDNAEDQKDLYQEIVFQLWKSYPSFKGDSKFSTWLYRVGMNTAIAFLNNRKRDRLVYTGKSIEIPEQKDTVIQKKTERLYRAIKKLNIVERGIILLYLEDKSYREIGEITGFTENNIGTKMARIKKKLKKII